MNLPEPISINSVDSTQEPPVDEDDGYEMINDSDHNDSTNGDDASKNQARVVYSRKELVDIFKLVSPDYCPDWISNNDKFPRHTSEPFEEYRISLIDIDVTKLDTWMSRCSKNAKPGDRKDGEENGNKMPTQQYNKPRNPTDSDADNFGNNNRLSRPPYGSENRHYNQNAPPNTFNGAYKNNNANSNNAPFRDRQMYNNDRRAPANRMDDRNDGRGVPLRSRGENLNQNFAQGFRRFPNRNQQDGRQGGHQHKQEEPEWFTEGPISQHDTIELKGFDEDEDKLGASKNSSNSNVPPHHSPPQQQQQQQSRNNAPPMKANHHAQQRDDFDLSELSNFDWQNVNAHPNVDKDTIESIENSSRFARWFNDQPPAQSSENQLERLFSNARPPPPNHLNANLMNSQQLQQLHLQQQQQQLHLQNDFMGNLMGRGNLGGNLGPAAGGNGLNAIKQQINNNSNLLHGYPIKQPEVEVLFNSPQKKTDQQLLNILQKARINVDNLMGQQREIGQDQRAPKGHVKSAEELEASLFGSPEVPSTAMGCPQQPAQHVTADLLRKLCLNSNQSDQANKPPQHLPQHQPHNQPLQQFMREENSAINPFVMNLLDAQKLKNASPVNRGKPNNYLPNMMFNNSGGGVGSSQEKVHNPFMPTSVIRKIAAKEKNVQMNRNVNANMNEIVNFETVTGNQVSERSILNRLGLGDSQPRAMNHQDNFIANLSQPNVMKQNFAITTADSWNNDPHHGNFNMHPQHLQQQQHPAMNQSMEGARAMHNNEELKNILMKAQTRKPNANLNNLANNQNNQFPRAQQNNDQKKLIEILQKASTNYNKAPTDTGNKINNWFELELKRNNDHLSPIIKENAFTLEDIERS